LVAASSSFSLLMLFASAIFAVIERANESSKLIRSERQISKSR
jgi:hypothetical protein